MRAAVLEEIGKPPVVREFDDPDPDAEAGVAVRLAGCNPVDLALAAGEIGGRPDVPKVVGKEGVGFTIDGERVYFDSPPTPFGSWAERTLVDPEKVYPVPDGIDDDLAVALGIAGLAAWLPLTRHADVVGRSVLILGATGVVGNIAVQAAKLLYAGRVVAAGRDVDALEKTRDLGADAIVPLGDDTPFALRKEAGDDGYDVVLDLVYGDPFLAALDASAPNSTLITVGQGAGASADIPFVNLMGRTHVGHLNDMMPADVVSAGYAELTEHAVEGRIRVETTRYSLDEAQRAWQAQIDGPHVKIGVDPT